MPKHHVGRRHFSLSRELHDSCIVLATGGHHQLASAVGWPRKESGTPCRDRRQRTPSRRATLTGPPTKSPEAIHAHSAHAKSEPPKPLLLPASSVSASHSFSCWRLCDESTCILRTQRDASNLSKKHSLKTCSMYLKNHHCACYPLLLPDASFEGPPARLFFPDMRLQKTAFCTV